jgi:tetratricopeptide (TPR) repeat protein
MPELNGEPMKLACILLLSLCASTAVTAQQPASQTPAAKTSPQQSVLEIVSRIQRADYEGDRASLDKLYQDLTPFVDEPEVASRVRYWRGFAKWRRGINGFNETPTPNDLAQDMTEGESEFDAALRRDPDFLDAKIAAASCVLYRLFLQGTFFSEKDPARLAAIMAPASQLLKEAKATAPDNPRLLWVLGPNAWSTSPERGGGQDKAMELYQKGLANIHAQKNVATSPLEPSWGEPELLMNLAWSNLNRKQPDLAAARRYAQSALEIVPYWHYVRDILMPQIQQAERTP